MTGPGLECQYAESAPPAPWPAFAAAGKVCGFALDQPGLPAFPAAAPGACSTDCGLAGPGGFDATGQHVIL